MPDACKVIAAAALHQILAGTPKSIQPFNSARRRASAPSGRRPADFRVLNINVAGLCGQPDRDGQRQRDARTRRTTSRSSASPAKPPRSTRAAAGHDHAGRRALASRRSAPCRSSHWQERHRPGDGARAGTATCWSRSACRAQASGGFGPVTIGELRSGALAVARAVLAARQVRAHGQLNRARPPAGRPVRTARRRLTR